MSDKQEDPKREFFTSLGQLVFWGAFAAAFLFLIAVFDGSICN